MSFDDVGARPGNRRRRAPYSSGPLRAAIASRWPDCPSAVHVRDSKDPLGPSLTLPPRRPGAPFSPDPIRAGRVATTPGSRGGAREEEAKPGGMAREDL
ncbi:DUF397 domain-containing protein [Streptomyces sp. ST2-7A]|nr:DUF397 domain-containing protein [Streptomyces sp. ST2-7A]